MKRGISLKNKRAQFYIIAAVVIVAVILSLTTISNYVTIKKEPQKNSDAISNLNYEALKRIDNLNYNNQAVDINVKNLTDLFSRYLENNAYDNFVLVIYYGNITSALINKVEYRKKPTGTVSVGGIAVSESSQIEESSSVGQVFTDASGAKFVNVSINGVSYTSPVLNDNNLIIVFSTSDEFNTYVETNL